MSRFIKLFCGSVLSRISRTDQCAWESKPVWLGAAVFLIYLLFSCLLNFHGRIPDFSNELFALGYHYYPAFFWKDPAWYVWAYAWWPYAILHGLNPFMTEYMWYPFQTDLAVTTAIPTLSLLFAPLTLLAGPIVSFNFVQLLAPAFDGFSAYLLAKKITKKLWPSFIGGLFFGFSPYVFGKMPIHPHMSFVAFVPLGALLYLAWRRREVSDVVFVCLGAILMALQIGVSPEILAFSALAAVFYFSLFFYQINWRLVKCVAIMGVVALTLTSPFLYYFLIIGRQAISIPDFSSTGMDLLYILLPLPQMAIHMPHVNVAAFDIPEMPLYIGPAVLAFLILSRKEIGWRLLALLAIFALISIGSPVMFNGHKTDIINPLGFIHFLPLMNHAVIMRFSLMFWLTLSVAIAIVLSKSEGRTGKKTLILVLLAGISLFPNPNWTAWYPLTTPIHGSNDVVLLPRPFLDKNFRRLINGKAYILLPYNTFGGLWEAASGMNFKAFGIYGNLNYSGIMHTPSADRLLQPESSLVQPLVNQGQGVIDDDWAHRLTVYCRENSISGILMDEDSWAPRKIVDVLRKAGWIEQDFDSLAVLDVPES